MLYNVSNWLATRGAGVLFRLQETPVTAALSLRQALKPSGSKIYGNNHKLFPGWPHNSVFKIRLRVLGFTHASINDLYLETTSVLKYHWDPYYAGVKEQIDNGGSPAMTGMFTSCDWVGGDDNVYTSGTCVTNSYAGKIEIGGNLVDAWTIISTDYLRSVDGIFVPTSTSVTYNALAPLMSGMPCVWNGGGGSYYLGDPLNSAYASFSGLLTSRDLLDNYSFGAGAIWNSGVPYRFDMRHPDDAPHDLSSHISGFDVYGPFTGNQLFSADIQSPDTRYNGIFSYEPSSSEHGAGVNQRARTTCKWMYYSQTCQDCWYKDKVINVEVKYKKLSIVKNVTPPTDSSTTESIINESGTWEDYGTVPYSLTLTSGTGTRQLGESFEVPIAEGYIVAIDDIKVVSIT